METYGSSISEEVGKLALSKWGKYNVIYDPITYVADIGVPVENHVFDLSDLRGGKSYWINPYSGSFNIDDNYTPEEIGDITYVYDRPQEYIKKAIYMYEYTRKDQYYYQYYYTSTYIGLKEIQTYSKGAYISDIIAQKGTYPQNGSDGSYWYVYIGDVSSNEANVGGVWRSTQCSVNVNGVIKSVTENKSNVSGIWQ